MKRKVLVRIITFVALFASFALAQPADAWIGTGGATTPPGGGSGSGGGCSAVDNRYRIDCAGVSWIYYKSINTNPSDAHEIKFPVYANASGAVRYDNAVIPAECAQHTSNGGGFWHFGYNAFPGSDWYMTNFYNGQPISMGSSVLHAKGNSSSAARAGHWETTTWGMWTGTFSHWNSGLLKTNTSADQIIESLYQADPSKPGNISNDGSSGTVYEEFKKTWEIDRPGEPVPSAIPSDVYAFCYYGDTDYLSESNVSAMDSSTMRSEFDTTDIVVSGETEIEITVKQDTPLQIIFSHNPYASKTGDIDVNDPAKWDLYRIYYKEYGEDQGGYTAFNNTRPEWFEIENADTDTANGTFDPEGVSVSRKDGDITSWTDDSSGYYIGNEREYTDSVSNFAARDAITVTFKEAGEWRFCEEFRVFKDEDSIDAGAKTKACVKITVDENPNQYYSVSNASNDTTPGTWVTTGIVNYQRKVTSEALEVQVGESVTMTFSHNAYSLLATDTNSVPWEVTRNWSVGLGYTVTPMREVTRSGSHPMNLAELNYYTIDNAYRHNERDDGTGAFYIVREIYQVTFSAPGTKEFCETIKVDGGELTTSCVKVTASYNPPVLNRCGEWTPDTYLISGVLQGSVMKGTTSLTSKIKNKDLTSRNASGPYSNWLGLLVPNIGSTYGSMQTTYGKPGDEINWANCYYPGAQALYRESVITGNAHIEHTRNYRSHPTSILGANITYRNDYKITSSTDSVNGVFKVGSSVIGMPNDVVPPTNVSFWGNGNGSNPWILNAEILRGDATARESSHDYDIRYRDDAGKTYKEIMTSTGQPYYAQIDYAYHSWRLPCGWWYCTYWHTNSFQGRFNYTHYSYNSGALTSQTQVIIPYNFTNSAKFDITPTNTNGVVYPGDTVKIDNAEVKVGERRNDVTAATYITQVDNAEVRLISYVSDISADDQIANIGTGETGVAGEQTPVDYGAASTNICDTSWIRQKMDKKQCMEVNKYMYDGVNTTNSPATTTLYNRENNTASVTYGDTTGSYKALGFSRQYNVYDAAAGDYMCFVMAVFPWRSGPEHNDAADKTTNPAGTESKWLITAPRCLQIAKKPSMQVLGSSIYTKGGITSTVSNKHNLFAETTYFSTINASANPTLYFGSFDEQAVVARGQVTRFASGAAVGRVAAVPRTSTAAGYGATNNDFCDRWTPLTFANYSKASEFFGALCGNGADAAGNSGIQDASIVDREALVDYFIPRNTTPVPEGTYNLSGGTGWVEIPNGTNKDIWYVSINGGATITASTLGGRQTRVLKASDDVTINGNIIYSGNYGSAAEVPKAVIYSANDIHINCNVDRIDAILIAGGTVYSCNDYTVADTGTMENRDRSVNQLVINGAVLADRVELGRTYGSAAGNKSGVAAEIVNYDTSSLVWGRSMAGANDSNAMSTVYLHELAPRY